jgi:UDP-2,3-diacylglucosamine pyrophosphatase LpxH
VRTALISDLHLGSASGEDLLRDPGIREVLLAEISSADRLVLLGDAVELRDLPQPEALELSRPFFEEVGAALAGREVVLVPGNHDHHLAEPLLESAELAGEELDLEQRSPPAGAAAERIAGWLGEARLEIAYPGLWLREDVYATHGHYMDLHLTVPRAECVAAAAVMRGTGRPPDPARPGDYERALRPVYGVSYGLAQTGALVRSGGTTRASERAWRWMSADGPGGHRPARRLAAAALARGAIPATVWSLNRLLGSSFEADLSARAISRGGITAAVEMARRLRIRAPHVITGHNHRAGPRESEQPWEIPGGGLLHNTGNWIFTAVLHPPGARPGPYWPGTVTWLEASGPPRQTALLADRGVEDLSALARGGRVRLTGIASSELG